MNPEQARSIRFKKRLEEQLDLKDRDQFDGNCVFILFFKIFFLILRIF